MPASDGRGNRLNYNGIEIFDVLTKGVSEEVVYDPTNTDMVATKVEIALTGLLSTAGVDDGGAATVHHTGGSEGTPFDGTIRGLNDNRKWFIYWVGNQPLYAVWPIEFWHLRHGELDAAYCPSGVAENFYEENWWSAGLYDSAKIETGIVNIVSDRTARVDITLTFTYIPCNATKSFELADTLNGTGGSTYVANPDDHSVRVGDTLKAYSGNQNNNDDYEGSEYGIGQCPPGMLEPTWESVLSNKWRTADNINTEDWLCERTISGTIELSTRVGSINSHTGPDPDSEAVKAPLSPHYVRFLTIPPLQNGFKRTGLSFSESEDNLKLDYEITDKEVYVQAPWPACSFEASVSTSIKPLSGGMGSMPMVKVECSMAGRKHVDKKLLLQAMIHVMNTKTNFLQTISSFSCFPSSFDITESMTSNSIKGNLEVMLKPNESGTHPFSSVMKFLTATFGQGTVPGDPGYRPGDENRGLTDATIPQQRWGAPEPYNPQRARKDLQYPDDCYLLGPLSSLFIPMIIARHGLRAESGAAHATTQFSYVGNGPCTPVTTYDTSVKKVKPIIRTNSLGPEVGDFNDGSGRFFDQDYLTRDAWTDAGLVTNPSTERQEGPFSRDDSVLGNARISRRFGAFNFFPYIAYNINTEVRQKEGNEVIAAAHQSLPVSFTHRRSMPLVIKTYKFFAARVNKRPALPLAEDFREPGTGFAHYIVDSKYNFANAIPSSDGLSILFVAAGTLVFVCSDSRTASRGFINNIFTPTAPDLATGVLGTNPFLNFVNSSDFFTLGGIRFINS